MFSKEDYDLLSPVVDGLSLMTYDYPNHGRYYSILTFKEITSIHDMHIDVTNPDWVAKWIHNGGRELRNFWSAFFWHLDHILGV